MEKKKLDPKLFYGNNVGPTSVKSQAKKDETKTTDGISNWSKEVTRVDWSKSVTLSASTSVVAASKHRSAAISKYANAIYMRDA